MTKKVRKSRILASQNPPQTLPKSFQNRCPKKHANFASFLTVFIEIKNVETLKIFIFPMENLYFQGFR